MKRSDNQKPIRSYYIKGRRKIATGGLLALLFFLPLLTLAQQAVNIQGSIVDEKNQGLPGATVKLLKSTDTVVLALAGTDYRGRFSFKIQPGTYQVRASMVGYGDCISKAFKVGQIIIFEMAPVQLKANLTVLNTVNVTGTKKVVEVKNGRLIYNIEQSAAAAGSTALDLLRRTPGVSVDQNETVLLKGSASVNVLLDGKMTYLSSQQLSNMLGSMNADQISRIEIITAPSAQFDATGNAGIINIVTKKSNKDGYAANISAGTTISRYVLHSESMNGNIKTDRINFFGGLGYSYRHTYSDEISRQIIGGSNNATILDRHGNNPHVSNFYSYKGGFDLYLSKNQQIGMVYTGSTDDWSKDASGVTTIKDAGEQTLSSLRSHTYTKEPYYNNAFNLNYKLKLDSLGKSFTVDGDYIRYRNNSDGYLTNQAYDLSEHPAGNYNQLNFHQPSNINIRSVKTDLDLPFKSFRAKAGLKYSSVGIDNNFRYDSLMNGNFVYAPSLSDHFVYQEKIAAAYLSVAKDWKTFSLEAGLRAEHTFADGNSISTGTDTKHIYTDLFPSLSITEQLSKSGKLDLSLSRRINRPNYANLNPVRYYADQYSYYQGNPNLLPEKAWAASLAYTWLDKYIFSLGYNRADNFISRSAVVDPLSGILMTSNTNYPHKARLEVGAIIPVTFTAFWDASFTATYSYTTYPLTQIQGYKNVNKSAIDLFADQSFKLPGSVAFELMTRYTSPDLNGVYMERYYFSMDGGFKKTFLNKKMDARLSFSDLFHTGWYWGYSISNTANYNYKNTPDSRRLSLTLIYHLGGKMTGGKPRQTEEQQRL